MFAIENIFIFVDTFRKEHLSFSLISTKEQTNSTTNKRICGWIEEKKENYATYTAPLYPVV